MEANTIILVINSLLYICSLLIYQRKTKSIQVGSVVLFLYSVISIGSVYLYTTNTIWDFEDIKIFPFIYLYIILMISFKPAFQFNNQKTVNMIFPDRTIMNILSVIIFIASLLFFTQIISTSFNISELFDASVLADNHYDKGEAMTGNSRLLSILSIFRNVFLDLLWIMFMYNLIKHNRILSIMSLFSIVVSVFASLAWGGRGSLVSVILGMIITYVFFKPLLSKKQNKTIIIALSVVVTLILVGFLSMTIGRWGDVQRFSIFTILVYYLSSNFIMFNNYALDPGGCRYGDRVFPLIRKLFGLDTAEDFMDRRDKFPQLQLDDSQFSFFVGEFCIDFGPIIAALIIILFSYVFYKILKKKQYDLGDILLGVFWCRIITYGFALFPYSEISGNLRILYVIFFTFLFKRFTRKTT